jgi:hypothetical protein
MGDAGQYLPLSVHVLRSQEMTGSVSAFLRFSNQRQAERDALLVAGKRPYKTDIEKHKEEDNPLDLLATYRLRPNIRMF